MTLNLYLVGEKLYNQGKYEESIYWLDQSIETSRQISDNNVFFKSSILLAYSYLELGEYDDAESVLESIRSHSEDFFKQETERVHYYIVMSIINLKFKKMHNSVFNINGAIEIVTRILSHDLSEHHSYYEKMLGRIYMIAARIHFTNRDTPLSIDFCNKSMELSSKHRDFVSMTNVKQVNGEIEYFNNRKHIAVVHFEEAKTYSLRCERNHELFKIDFWLYLCKNQTDKLHNLLSQLSTVKLQNVDLSRYYHLTGVKIIEVISNKLSLNYKRLSQCRDSFLKNEILKEVENQIEQIRVAKKYMEVSHDMINEGR